MKRVFLALSALVALTLPLPAAAQQQDIIRDRFPFVGGLITVSVQAAAPGRLSIIRGSPGVVTVTGRVAGGIAAAALDDRGHLTLNAAGDGEVNYVVAVPTDVRIRVQLPEGGAIPALGARSAGGQYRWGASQAAGPAPGPLLTPPSDDPLGPDLFTIYYSPTAPAEVSLPDARVIRSLSVRFEGADFRVGASRPLSVRPGGENRVEIRPSDPPLDLVLIMPLRTRDFSLALGGQYPLLVRGGETSAYCKPLIRQRLSGGRVWFTFSVPGDALQCTTAPDPRHKG